MSSTYLILNSDNHWFTPFLMTLPVSRIYSLHWHDHIRAQAPRSESSTKSSSTECYSPTPSVGFDSNIQAAKSFAQFVGPPRLQKKPAVHVPFGTPIAPPTRRISWTSFLLSHLFSRSKGIVMKMSSNKLLTEWYPWPTSSFKFALQLACSLLSYVLWHPTRKPSQYGLRIPNRYPLWCWQSRTLKK